MISSMKNFLLNFYTIYYYFYLCHLQKKYNKYDSIQDMEDFRNKCVKKIMKRAYEIPLYKSKFDKCKLKPEDFKSWKDLTRFPTLTKIELRDWLEKVLNEKGESKFYIQHTSGSSGIHINLLFSIREMAYSNALWLRTMKNHGINIFFDKTFAVKNHIGRNVNGNRDSILQNLGLCKRYCFPSDHNMDEVISVYNKVKPDFLYAHANALLRMVQYANIHSIVLHKPKAVNSNSEKLFKNAIELIQNCFGKVLFDNYGLQETSSIASTRINNFEKYDVNNDSHILLLKKDDECLETFEDSQTHKGELVVTTLFRNDFPIINYEAKDIIESGNINHVDYIKSVQGRATEWFKFANDGLQYGMSHFLGVSEPCPYVAQIRFIQNDLKNLTVEIVPLKEYENEHKLIENYLIDKLNNFLSQYDLTYHFVYLDTINFSNTGKIRFLESTVKC